MPLDIERVHKPIRRLRNFFKKAPKAPSAKKIHDLRTSTRRLQAEVGALGLGAKKNERRLLEGLERVRKRAGKIRDIDVLTGYLLNLNGDQEQQCRVKLVEDFGARREKQAAKLRKIVLKSGPELRRRLKRTLSKMDKLVDASDRPRGNSSRQGPAEATARALRIATELKAPARLNQTNLHPYRLKVKELRYVLQLSDKVDQQEFVDKLGEVKDAIGEWHDWGELMAIATETLDHGAECRLIPYLKTITEEKYNRALALANEMREKFIAAPSRNRRARTAPKSIHTEPVLASASSIMRRQ
jgi:CHAD domain-containing protein